MKFIHCIDLETREEVLVNISEVSVIHRRYSDERADVIETKGGKYYECDDELDSIDSKFEDCIINLEE